MSSGELGTSRGRGEAVTWSLHHGRLVTWSLHHVSGITLYSSYIKHSVLRKIINICLFNSILVSRVILEVNAS